MGLISQISKVSRKVLDNALSRKILKYPVLKHVLKTHCKRKIIKHLKSQKRRSKIFHETREREVAGPNTVFCLCHLQFHRLISSLLWNICVIYFLKYIYRRDIVYQLRKREVGQ